MADQPDTKFLIKSEFDPEGVNAAQQAIDGMKAQSGTTGAAASPAGGGADAGALDAATKAQQALTDAVTAHAAAVEGDAAKVTQQAQAVQAGSDAQGAHAGAVKADAEAMGGHAEAMQADAQAAQEGADAMAGHAEAVQEDTQVAQDGAQALTEHAQAAQENAREVEASSAAAEEAAQRDEALRLAMELETKTAKQLKEEMAKLQAERKKAAAAGDAETYKKLAERYNACKAALGKFSQENKLGSIAMMQQAQTGIQLAGTLGGLAEKCKDGTVSLGDLAGAVIAVSMAIKAGMGPIGWLLMAIQGLQMAWDWYSDSQEKAQKAEADRVKGLHEAEMAHLDLLEKLAEAQRGLILDGWKKEVDDLEKRQAEISKKREMERTRAEQAAQGEDQRRKDAAKAAYDQEKAAIDLLLVKNQIDTTEAERRRRVAEDAMNAELAGIERAAVARRNSADLKASYAAKAQAEALQKELQETYGKFDDILKVQMPSKAEWDALQLKLQSSEYDMRDFTLSRNIKEQANEIQKALAEMGVTIAGGPEDVIAFLDQLKEGKKAGEALVQAKLDEVEASRTNAGASKQEFDTLEAKEAADKATLEAQRRVADAKAEQAKIQEEWASVQQRSVAEQAAWLQKQMAGVAEGSEQWKKYNAQLQKVNMRGVSEALGRLDKEFRVTGKYAVEDNRSQRQIWQADKKALLARQAKLRALLATPDLDAATATKINDALTATNKEIAGLKQTMAKNTQSARKWLRELKPPQLQGKSKQTTKALGNLAKMYKKAAAKAAKAAEKGDAKGLERAKRQMGVYAKNMHRLAKQPAAADKMHRATMAHLRDAGGAAAATAKAEKGQAKSAKDKSQAAKKAAKASKDAGKAQAEDAKALKEQAAAHKKTAQAAKKATPKAKSAGQKITALTSEVKSLQGAMKDLDGKAESLAASLKELAALAGKTAATMASGTAATAAAISGLKSEINKANKAIDTLRRCKR